jgi:hypothetical protein
MKTLLPLLLFFQTIPEQHSEAYLTVRHYWRVNVQHVRDVRLHYHYLQYLCEEDHRGSCDVRSAIDLFR